MDHDERVLYWLLRFEAVSPSEREPLLDELRAAEPSVYDDLVRQYTRIDDVGAPPFGTPIPAGMGLPTSHDDLDPGQILGQYRVVRHIRDGGMGRIYEVERMVDFPQRGALKILRSDLVMRSDAVARFDHERTILARLDHPDIISIIDGGSLGSQPYLVMPLVRGLSWAERLHEPLDHLAIFLRVCDALGYVHGCQVVHRDLNFRNILIDDSGRPRIIDFGIAIPLGPSRSSQPTELAGSHGFMAPEQLRREPISPATDVFALGVILFRLVAGQMPFSMKDDQEALESICRDDPAWPEISISRDLKAVCERALAKDPRQRYATAAELAADLRLHLAGHATTARPASWLMRRWKWARRRPTAAALATLVGLVAFVGFPLTGFLWQRSERQRQAAHQQRLKGIEFANDIVRQFVESRTIDRPEMMQALAQQHRRIDQFLGDLERDTPDDRDLTLLRAQVLYRIAYIEMAVGDRSSAHGAHDAVLTRTRLLLREGRSDPTLVRLHLSTLINSGWLLSLQGRNTEALPFVIEADDFALRHAEPNEPASLWRTRMEARLTIAEIQTNLEQWEAALQTLDRIIAERPDRYGADGRVMEGKVEVHRGEVFIRCGRFDEADRTLRRAEALRRSLAEQSPDHLGLQIEAVFPIHLRGRLALRQKQFHEAVELLTQAESLQRAILMRAPKHTQVQFQLAEMLIDQAAACDGLATPMPAARCRADARSILLHLLTHHGEDPQWRAALDRLK